jgi:spore germination cell wall hydrolase CwlJ-like protein
MLEILCLTVAIYYEARGEPIEGQAAVAQVILNRVQHPDFPDDACAVVFEPDQFSFVGDPSDLIPPMVENEQARRATERAAKAALEVVEGYHTHITSTHYHADYVEPYWADVYTLDFRVGNHIFYSCQPEQRNC